MFGALKAYQPCLSYHSTSQYYELHLCICGFVALIIIIIVIYYVHSLYTFICYWNL